MQPETPVRIQVIDSHTGGEPTRVVLDGVDLNGKTMTERRAEFRERYDWPRSAAVCDLVVTMRSSELFCVLQ